MTRSEKLRALLVLTGFLALLGGTPVLLAWLTRHAPDLAVRWPSIDTGIFAPPVLAQLEHWWTQATWPQLIFGFEDGDLIVWMVALAGWACWILLVWHTLAELAVCLRLGAAYAHQRLTGIGPRTWISGAVTTVLIGLAPGTAHAAGPPRQPIAATAPQHPDRAYGDAGHAVAPAIRDSLTAGGVADPQAPRQSDPFVLDADVRPDLPRYTVVPGDTLWDLARRYLGDPRRYPDILGLNADRLPGGTTVLRPGWVLLLPAQATGLPAQGESLPAGTTWVTVARGDTLTSIAERHLGNGDNWTMLWQLNDHRRQPDGRVLRDPNLLLPGWRIAVPPSTPDTRRTPDTPLTNPFPPPQAQTSAAPPTGRATPASPPTTHERPPTPSGAPMPTPGTGLVQLPSGGLAALGLAVAVAAAVEVLRRRRRHIRDIPADEDDDVAPVVPPLPQVLQILHRAGHATTASPNREDDETAEHGLPVRARWPPDPVFVTGYDPQGQPRQLDLAAVVGLGLTGAGAAGVVRGVLAAELLARYQQPTEVYLLDDTTCHILAGTHHPGGADTDQDQYGEGRQPDSVALAGIAGVHLAAGDAHQDRVLAGLEAELARRARLIAEASTPVSAAHREDREEPSSGWEALRRAQPDLRLPTIVIVATPAVGEGTSEVTGRLAAVCDQGRSMGIHGLLLGAWPTEIDLDAQATVAAAAGAGSDLLLGTRLQQLTAAEFREITELARTLRSRGQSTPDTPAEDTESTMPASAPLQPDTAPPAASTESTGGMVGATAIVTAFPATATDPETTEDPTNATSPAAVPAPARMVDEAPVARLHLLGAMRLHVAGRDVTGLRNLSWELLAYLGTHPDGATAGLLEDELLADRHSGNPRNLLQKAVSHARTLLREATGGRQADFLTTRGGRYHLDHDHLTCDVVELHHVLHTARTSRDDEARRHAQEHLAQLCQAGPPLPDAGYHWAEEVRQYLTSRVLPVLRTLATNLADTDPESALEVLETATSWEPYAESLYRDTIALHRRLGHPEAARATYRLLTTRLSDIDRAPENTTHALVADMAT